MAQAILLPVGPDLYALELEHVREVVPEPVITPLPGAPPVVCGVLSLRGEVVPVLDTTALLGLDGGGSSSHAVVVEAPAGLAALTAGAAPRVVELGAGAGPSQLPGARGRFAAPGGAVATLLVVSDLLPGRLEV